MSFLIDNQAGAPAPTHAPPLPSVNSSTRSFFVNTYEAWILNTYTQRLQESLDTVCNALFNISIYFPFFFSTAEPMNIFVMASFNFLFQAIAEKHKK